MSDDGRVVTAKLPEDLVSEMDSVAARIDRSKSWIVKQAVAEWLAEERRRDEMTLEALDDVDQGQTIPHADIQQWAIEQKQAARRKSAA
jgi:predicted transcriptional regulator